MGLGFRAVGRKSRPAVIKHLRLGLGFRVQGLSGQGLLGFKVWGWVGVLHDRGRDSRFAQPSLNPKP